MPCQPPIRKRSSQQPLEQDRFFKFGREDLDKAGRRRPCVTDVEGIHSAARFLNKHIAAPCCQYLAAGDDVLIGRTSVLPPDMIRAFASS